MVNQETSLESLILDIFEEQEDSFYFPVRSQRDARAFVKAIHLKGVPYDKIYDSIGEFEHNFSCWRNGLGRPGIGNRIIELINQPLVDLLEEDDLYPVNGSHANGLHESSKLESPRSWEDNHRVPPTHQPTKDETDSGPKVASTTTSSHRNNPPASQEPTYQKSQSAPESTSPLPARSEMRRVEQNDKPAEQKEEAPRRMVELRRTPPRQEKKERPVSELEKMKQQILSKKSESEETEAKDAKKEKKLERSSSSESSESESGSSSSSSSSSSESDTKVETVLGKFDAIKITESPVEEAPPKKPERLFLDEKKEQEEEKKREEMKRKIMREHEERREEMKKEDQRNEELKREDQRNEELKREERKEQLKRIKEKYNQAPPAGTTIEDVDENYNSDLDPENTNQSPVMATLVKKISAMRAAGKNSTGYVYVFSDSAQGSTKVRVKVGSSRCPNKRLQQAKCFNPDMYLVATYPVSQRVSALNDIQASLSRAKLDGASDWFTGALNDLLEVVQNNANKYPSKTIHDATIGQSET